MLVRTALTISIIAFLAALLLPTYIVMTNQYALSSTHRIDNVTSVKSCSLVVVVDNYPNPHNKSLRTAWGVSILVRAGNKTILFDTGPDPEVLKHNMDVLGIKVTDIDFVVISHEHGDHVGGLPYIAKVRPGLTVYVPEGMSNYVKKWIKGLGLKVVEVRGTTLVARGVAIIGEMYGPPWEQALAVNVRGVGLVIIVGCSHPGVTNIVEKAVKELGVKPYLVIGGFHMIGASESACRAIIGKLISLGVSKIAPIHCSGDLIRNILRKEFKEHYIECYVGADPQYGVNTR